ncbi:MAG: AMP-binding protein [Planctomycetota bacterium]|jgi:long-subunit acyl-CoA synthetase (AMP-forming)
MLQDGELGIHPPGALGVAFFVHARAESFVGHNADGITQPLKEAGSIRLQDANGVRPISLPGRIFANLLEADALDRMPELLLACCNPDQLGVLTGELTRFLENLAERDHLRSADDIRQRVPILLVMPNGILSEQTLETYAAQLSEAQLLDRLPGVTDDMIEAIMARVVRGISLQAGGRRGSGAETVYVLEGKGQMVFAGGGEQERQRIEAILNAHDYPFMHVRGVPGTRIEFDKAMISIVLNVGGLIHTVKPSGELIDLRMGDQCKDPTKADFVHDVTRAVFDVGKAIGAYGPDASYDEVWSKHRATILKFSGHVTSSLKTFRDALASGLDGVKLFSNEEWILTPLARYAATAGLKEEENLFRTLRHRVQEAMARAIKYRDQASDDSGSKGRTMKLAAQRNISIELFETGREDIVLVGTLLDQDHLIKLELTVHLPDEQITQSRLNMIRVPFPVCHEVEKTAERLVGLRIERGVLNEIGARVGGSAGCSHIKELATGIMHFVASFLVGKRAGVDPLTTEFTHTPPEERFRLTKDLLRDSCLAYCQATSQDLDEHIGIRRLGEQHDSPIPLGEYEPTLGKLLHDRVERHGDKVYLRYRKGDEEIAFTYREFAGRTFQIARHLIDQDVRPGHRICMISENRAEMYFFEMAAMSIGAVTVPVFAGYPPPQIDYVLHHSRPRFVVVSGQHQLDKIDRAKYPSIEKYYSMDFDAGSEAWGALDFSTLTADGGATTEATEARLEAVNPDDLCMIMYTSGTTRAPKGVQLCHRNLISQQKAMSLMWDVGPDDVYMNYLPWHHSFGGLFERFMSLYNGCELCLDDSRGRDLDRLLANWKVFRPTLFFSVPRVHAMVMDRCRESKQVEDMVFSGRLRWVFTAGASLPAGVESVYRDHDVTVLEGWGLTEAAPCLTATTLGAGWRSGFVGGPLPGVSIRIDTEQEILVKGPNVMLGYLDDAEATSRVLDEDGWLHTGDLGEFTPEGLRILGRKDGAFKLTTGEKVHPHRIENTLVDESPYIGTALVIGSGRDFVGALICPDFGRLRAWAERKGVSGDRLTEQPAVRELYAAELARINPLIEVKYQRIKRAVLGDHVPSLERGEVTPSGKIVRRRVCDIYKHELEELFKPQPADCVVQITEEQFQET